MAPALAAGRPRPAPDRGSPEERGGYARAIRAPNVGELFSAATGGQAGVGNPPASGEPCDIRTLARQNGGAQLRALCIATGVPANIAEGFVKRGKADKLRFYNIGQGSLEECRYYLILAQDLGYAHTEESMAAIDEVSRMLEAYIHAIATNRRGFFSFFWSWMF